jgi:hypothetical protein
MGGCWWSKLARDNKAENGLGLHKTRINLRCWYHAASIEVLATVQKFQFQFQLTY